MRLISYVLGCFLLFAGVHFAQHGSAPSGWWPLGYHGDTWTGEVSAVNDATREITLVYRKKNKTETFTGVLKKGYKVEVEGVGYRELKVSEIPLGTRLRVYYMAKWRKVKGKKEKYYEIFELADAPSARQ